MNTVYNAHNLNILTRQLSTSIVLRNKICQLCQLIQRPQWEASLNQHVGICTTLLHTGKYVGFFKQQIRAVSVPVWRNIEIFMYTKINPAKARHVSTTVHCCPVPYGYYRRSVSPIRANTDHWICLLIEFQIFKNNLRCFVLKSDTCHESIILDYIFGG